MPHKYTPEQYKVRLESKQRKRIERMKNSGIDVDAINDKILELIIGVNSKQIQSLKDKSNT